MKKRLLCMLLALTTVFSLAAPAYAEAGVEPESGEAEVFTLTDAAAVDNGGSVFLASTGTVSGKFDNGVSWSLDDGTLTFSGSGEITGSADEEDHWIDVEKIVINSGVTGIGDRAFANLTQVTRVTIPTSVKSIGKEAFINCSSLLYLDLPAGLTKIGDGAFEDCRKLSTVDLPSSLTSIGARAFKYCSGLKEVKLPAGLTSIGAEAFAYCTGLTSMELPKALASLDSDAFVGCSSLYGFAVAEGNGSFYVENGVLFDANQTTLLIYPTGHGSYYDVPDKVTTIGASAFRESNLRSITLPDSVMTIGAKAFYYCRNLSSVDLSHVTKIGSEAFRYCLNLSDVTISNSASVGSNAFDGTPWFGEQSDPFVVVNDKLMKYNGSETTVEIPEGVTGIDAAAFENLSVKITSLTLPASLKSIDVGALSPLTSLKTIKVASGNKNYAVESNVLFNAAKTELVRYPSAKSGSTYKIPGTVTSIGAEAFVACYNLTGITISASVAKIGSKAFLDCRSLTSVKIPSTVTSIGDYAFGYRLDANNALYKLADYTISGYKGTVAETYASKNSITFKSLGAAATSLNAPKISSVENTTEGVKIVWKAVDGASYYRLMYKKSGSSETKIVDTTDTSYTWTKAKSGTKYTLSVRCVTADGKMVLSSASEKSITYVAAPKISSVTCTTSGLQINWKAVTGAAMYRVSYKNKKDGKWVKIADTKDTSLHYTDAVLGEEYTLMVRCVDSAGKNYTSAFYEEGFTITYEMPILAKPKISNVNNVSGGLKITWGKVKNAEMYRLYYKTSASGSWKKLDDTTKTSYTFKDAKKGKQYYFAVGCVSLDGKRVTSEMSASKSRIYIPVTKISSVSNTANGVKITWGKVTGAAKYRLYYKTSASGSWKKITDTTSTSYTWKKAKSGTTYYFAVRGVSASGKSLSVYDTKSVSIKYLAAPTIKSVKNTSSGVKITWGKVTGAVNYRVYYKTADGKWTVAGETTKTSFTWTKARTGFEYYYKVCCISKDGKTETSACRTTEKSYIFKR